MKTSLAILLLVNSAQSRLMSIGERLRQSPVLAQISNEKWDSDTLGLIDVDSYTRETRYATSDQAVNIEFENKKTETKKSAAKSVPVQKPMSIVQKTIANKLAEQAAIEKMQKNEEVQKMMQEKQLEEE